MKNNLTLAIMQPYFFPYLGHFSLIASVDKWIVFDITQYTKERWMNRNRILHPNSGWQYISVPLSNSSSSIRTFEAKILHASKTRNKICGKLSHYNRRAPYFRQVNALVNEVFDLNTDDSLVNLNVRSLNTVCHYLDIPFNYQICSELLLPLPEKLGPGEWALEICSLLGATRYVNPASGQDLFDPTEFVRRGISLNFAQATDFVYSTTPYQFEPNLSILDVLMWNSPEAVSKAIRNGSTVIENTPPYI